jgi:glutaredoxin
MKQITAEIFTKNGCIWCVRAKSIFDKHKITYTEYSLGVNGVTKETIENKIGPRAQVKTLPQIFLDGKYIGGCSELMLHLGE